VSTVTITSHALESGSPHRSTAITFDEVFRAAVSASGLSLDRIQNRLRQRGISISTAALSYWQTGRSRPGRRQSVTTVAHLEDVLGLPAGALVSLIEPHRRRGTTTPPRGTDHHEPWLPHERVRQWRSLESRWDEHLVRLSQHDRLVIDDRRTERSLWSRNVIKAAVDGPDRWLFVLGGTDKHASPPRLGELRNCSLGRTAVDRESGLLTGELLFDRPLRLGQTTIIEYRIGYPDGGPTAWCYERELGHRVREYVQEICFTGQTRPTRVRGYVAARVGKPCMTTELYPTGSGSAHQVTLDADPGVHGIRWKWPD
jgi:hypothetical protein